MLIIADVMMQYCTHLHHRFIFLYYLYGFLSLTNLRSHLRSQKQKSSYDKIITA